MNVSLFLAWMVAATNGAPSSATWDLTPRLQVGQELVYDGSIHESRHSEGGKGESSKRLSLRAIVLQKSAKGTADVGLLTVFKESEAATVSKPTELTDAMAVHLDKIQVDPTGRARWMPSGAEIAPPIDPQMICEVGPFVEMPSRLVKVGDKWVLDREGQPSIRVEVLGPESVMGTRCLSLRLDQESQNWANEEISLLAWKVTTKLLFDPKSQSVFRLEREVVTREPAAPLDQIVRKVTLEQGTNVRFHGNVLQNQIEDFETAFKAQQDLDTALTLENATRGRRLHAIQHDLKFAMQRLYSTPYRPVIERMHDRAVAAEKWEQEAEKPAVAVLGGRREVRVGQKAPPFILHEVESGENVSLKSTRGESLVMVFVDPASELSIEALRTTLRAVEKEKRPVRVLAIGQAMDSEKAAELHRVVPGNYQVCRGGTTDAAYGVRGVPHVVCVDHQGILRLNQKGFGPEVYATLLNNLSQLPTTNVAEEKSSKRSFRR